ncbi:sugar-binding domain-containing protein [Gemmatimonadota bacterium]
MRFSPRSTRAFFVTAVLALAAGPAARGQAARPTIERQGIEGTLTTRWTARAEAADVPLPEYPRPQLHRERWMNLNGRWEYAVAERGAPRPASWEGEIRVPFAVESRLSGVARRVSPDEQLWYRRSFQPPPLAAGERLLLHFGAVDWEARVWVNGTLAGEHRGGYDPFTFDVTGALRGTGRQELIVSVWDPTNEGDQPRGKQVLRPRGIWYTAVTGIWQTVWLEPVPATYVRGLTIVPDAGEGRLTVTTDVDGAGADPGERVYVTVSAEGLIRASTGGVAGTPLTLSIPEPRLWSPDDPFLYDLEVRLASGDVVTSYAGLRSIDVRPDADGFERLFLNGEPLFNYGLLDQGWWPDGLYTAPTDEALRYDPEITHRLGFNTIRKHVKVEPGRWYYHADRLGLLVWQDMPSGDNESPESRVRFAEELEHVVAARINHPSIIMWVPFNEGWGQHDTEAIAARLKEMDPSRLVNNASGWTDRGVGDLHDVHSYPGPAMPDPRPGRAAVLGEFGGLGLPLAGHTWLEEGNWGYRAYESTEDLVQAYRTLIVQLRPLIGEGLAAAIYTQTTDVEIEVNGIMTYDRAVIKLPEDIVKDHERLFDPPPVALAVVPTSREVGQSWQYRTDHPGSNWQSYDDGAGGWGEGAGGFGTEGTPGAIVRTVWDTEQIWLRRTFHLDRIPANLWLRIHHDEDARVWINGVLVAELGGYTSGYVLVPLDESARGTLREGENNLAIHVTQTRGGQFVDVGLVEVRER